VADNVQLPGTGTGTADVIVATDDVGSAHHQLVKVEWGANGTANQTAATATAALPTMAIGGGTNAAAQVEVTNASTSLAASDADRRGVIITNYQTVPIYVDPSGGTAAVTHFRLDPGASLVLPVTTAVTGITAAAYTAAGDLKVHVITVA
jgi:hypothetical protein